VDDRKKLEDKLSELWLQAFATADIPFDRARLIFQKARKVDAQATRRLIGALAFNLIGVPILNITRPVRHTIGFDQHAIQRLRGILR
jgi:uncharacterized protein involved in cysteine biosynthesis